MRYFPSSLKPPPLPIASFTYCSKKHGVYVEREKDGDFAAFFVLCPRCGERCRLRGGEDDRSQDIELNFTSKTVTIFQPIICPCGWTVVVSQSRAYDVEIETRPVRPEVGFLKDRLVGSGSAEPARPNSGARP